MPLIECIPNISSAEPAVLDRVRQALHGPGVWLLHTDPGSGANRTVFTWVVEASRAIEVGCAFAEAVIQAIDMTRHKGAHPRIGALDVFPFVPIEGLDLEQTDVLARQVGRFIGEELGVPVYLYEHSASAEYRRGLAAIRKGGYERLPHKLADPAWQPDYGPAQFVPRSGATVLGARPFLVAYNLNLECTDLGKAKAIAHEVRSLGPCGPYRLPAARAIGWYIPEYGRCQVSMNLHRLEITGLASAFQTVSAVAAAHGTRVTGSELIGLVPKAALVQAGRELTAQPLLPEAEAIAEAIARLGLDELAPFLPAKRILEERLAVVQAAPSEYTP